MKNVYNVEIRQAALARTQKIRGTAVCLCIIWGFMIRLEIYAIARLRFDFDLCRGKVYGYDYIRDLFQNY